MNDNFQFIEINNLTKTYKGRDIPSVDNLSFKIEEGSIFGLLGPNGAGKTTTILILCNILRADSGEVNIAGYSNISEIDKIKPMIGVISQEIALYENLTAKENLQFFGGMYDIEPVILNKRIDELLARMELSEFANQRIKTFSGGMKRRVNLLVGILHMPRLLILDEPTVGVDVHSRSVIIEYLKELNLQGITILYTSHMLEEAQKLCTDVAIIDEGKIVKIGKTKDLLFEDNNNESLENLFLNLTGRNLRN